MKNVVLGITGSIAAYKACDIIGRLKDKKINVTVVMTKEAENFITPLSLQTLSANKVIRDLFALEDNMTPEHISLGRAADLVLIAPATAQIMARLAAGLADDPLSCLALCTRAPIVLCPAMNDKMFEHKLTQDNLKRLKEVGYSFVGPAKGRLACADYAVGRLAAVDDIVREALRHLR